MAITRVPAQWATFLIDSANVSILAAFFAAQFHRIAVRNSLALAGELADC